MNPIQSEATTTASIPATQILATFRKLRIDPREFIAREDGVVMQVSSHIPNREFRAVLTEFAKLARKATNPKVVELVDAVIINLTSTNSLTDQELDVLYQIAQSNGHVRLYPEHPVTYGMRKALDKTGSHAKCPECGFVIPKYPGRYPRYCPSCGGLIVPKKSESLRIKESLEFLERFDVVPSFQASDEEIFQALVEHVAENNVSERQAREIQGMFGRYSIEDGVIQSLRGEIASRKTLCRAIRTLREEDVFATVKVLSSCLTRVMIEGQRRGGDFYKVIGKETLRMMEKAFVGDLKGPQRFVKLFFLEAA